MIYKLQSEQLQGKRLVRTYINDQTGTETKLSNIYTHPDGEKYWAFDDLYKIPMMRTSMAQNISSMYGLGLTKADLATWCQQEKVLLNGNDPEKYQKLYAMVLEKERIINMTADPMKQSLALCTVYVLENDERIDYFDEAQASAKILKWKGQPEMVTFFLTWHSEVIGRYMKTLQNISKTVSTLEKKKESLLQGSSNPLGT